jgi:hypothetical protein
MKNILNYLMLMFLALHVQAQQVPYEIKRGDVQRDKVTKRTFGIQPVASDNEFFYYLYIPYRAVFNEISLGTVENHFIAKFRKDNLEQVVKKEIILEYNNRKRQFHGVVPVKNNFYLFSAFQNEQHKKHYLFVQHINKETLETEDNMKMIGEIDHSGIDKYNNTHFHHEISPDQSKILIYYNIVNKKKQNLRYGMYVFSDQMELIWKNENVVPAISEGVFVYQKFMIDNEGDVYLKGINYINQDNYYVSSNFSDRKFFSKDTYYADFPNYTTQLYRFSDKGNRLVSADLTLPGKFIRSMTFLPEKNGKVLCAGVYSDPGKISARGMFVCDFNFSTKEVSNIETREFGDELIQMGFDEKQIREFRKNIENKEEWDPFEYLLTDIRIDSKGNKYFIAEQFISGTKMERQRNYTVYKPIFLHNDLFVTRIDNHNKIEQIDKISKRQYLLVTDQFNSYTVLEKEGKLYFLFKEYLKKDTMFRNAEEGNGYIVSLDPKGNQVRSVFQAIENKEKLFLMPQTGLETPEKDLLFSTIRVNYKDYSVNRLIVE